MYNGSPLLSVLISSKNASSNANIQHNKNIEAAAAAAGADQFLYSVDDLLDNPWHYDCVVSPRLSSDHHHLSTAKSPHSSNHISPANAPSPPPAANNYRPAARPAAPPASPPKPAAAANPPANFSGLITQATSTYVSLASFINNADKSSYGSSAAAAGLDLISSKRSRKSITPVLSKCRDRESKTHSRGDPSRIRSFSGCVAVD